MTSGSGACGSCLRNLSSKDDATAMANDEGFLHAAYRNAQVCSKSSGGQDCWQLAGSPTVEDYVA